MNSLLTKKIVFDYLDGKHSTIQYKMIEEWLKFSGNQELFYQYLDEWESQDPQYIFKSEKGTNLIKEKIASSKPFKANSFINSKIGTFRINYYWFAAASVVLILSLIGYSHLPKNNSISYEKLVKKTKTVAGDTYEKINLSQAPLLVSLPDNSTVLLQPKGKISYSPKKYNLTKREVILSGEAFFEVQKNSDVPFVVYSNELITKVLGTSFTIVALPESTKTEVIVKTGKVAVFMQNDVDKMSKINSDNLTGLILEANDKVLINRKEFKIGKSFKVDPNQLSMEIQKLTFDFEEIPASEVLDILEKAYNVQFTYDEEKLSKCQLTAHLSDEPLIEKINLICLAIEATYEKTENNITIKSKGCN